MKTVVKIAPQFVGPVGKYSVVCNYLVQFITRILEAFAFAFRGDKILDIYCRQESRLQKNG